MLTTLASYRMITANLARSLSAAAAQPQVARESEYYLAHIRDAKTIDDFVGNDRLFNYAMKAFGLGDMSYAKAFMRKVLTEGIDDRNSFANKIVDSRYRDFAAAFNFARYNTATTVFDDTQQGTVDRYIRQAMEENAGRQNEGVRLALYFERKASTIESPLRILADAALLKVAQTALNLPASMSALDIDRQVQMISSHLDVKDLKDPDKLKKFLNRFVTLWEVGNPSAAPASPAILFSQPVEAGIDPTLLASLQKLKLGG